MNNTVLFLGAGFFAAFGYPVMNSFLFHALDLLEGKQRSFLTDLMLDAGEANSMIESQPKNLEDMLSLAVMGDRVGLYGRHDRARAPMLKKIYSYTPPENVSEFLNPYSSFQYFLGVVDNNTVNTPAAIITTNYDINVECALYRLNKVHLRASPPVTEGKVKLV